jgi:hypothetical protein
MVELDVMAEAAPGSDKRALAYVVESTIPRCFALLSIEFGIGHPVSIIS